MPERPCTGLCSQMTIYNHYRRKGKLLTEWASYTTIRRRERYGSGRLVHDRQSCLPAEVRGRTDEALIVAVYADRGWAGPAQAGRDPVRRLNDVAPAPSDSFLRRCPQSGQTRVRKN